MADPYGGYNPFGVQEPRLASPFMPSGGGGGVAASVDPGIPLNVNPPASPFAQLGTYAQGMNALTQMQLSQQQLQARRAAGQIIAGSPDLDTAQNRLFGNPVTAPFAGEFANIMRTLQQTQTQIAGEKQTQASSALGSTLKMLAAGVADPSTLPAMVEASLATASPSARATIEPGIRSMQQALLDGIPTDQASWASATPQQQQIWRNMVKQRFAGYAMAAGVSPEQFSLGAGKPTIIKGGGYQQPGMTSLTTGAFTPSGSAIPMTLAPTVVQAPNAEGSNVTFIAGGGAPHGAGVNPLTPGGAPAPGGLLVGPSAQAEKYLEASGKSAADLQDDINKDAATLPGALRRIDMMTQALGNFQAGGGADMRADVAKAMQAMRNAGATFISQSAIDSMANQSLPDTQVFNAQVKPLVIGELKAAAQGTGRVMRSEVDAFMQMMDSTTDPRALMQLLNQARYSLQVGYDRNQKFPEFKQLIKDKDPSVKGMDLSDFYSWYNKRLGPSNLPGQTGGGMNLAPVPESAAKGAEGGPRVTKGIVAAPATTSSSLPDSAKAQLKEGHNTTFGNGQVWTLKNGAAVQVGQ